MSLNVILLHFAFRFLLEIIHFYVNKEPIIRYYVNAYIVSYTMGFIDFCCCYIEATKPNEGVALHNVFCIMFYISNIFQNNIICM